MSKQKSLILLKMLMGILNFAILTFLAVIILYTIGMVRATYTARSFLNHITYLPMNPVKKHRVRRKTLTKSEILKCVQRRKAATGTSE